MKVGRAMSPLKRASSRLRRRRASGQAAIEFVLVIPTFVIFLLLIVEFGMLTYEYVSVANAVREGARYGAVNCGTGTCSETVVRDRTIQRSGNILTSANAAEVTVGWTDLNGGGIGKGDSVRVRVDHMFNFMFLPAGPGIPVVSCADMRLERNDRGSSLPAAPAC